VTSSGELQIKPSNGVISFGDSDNAISLSDGQISANRMSITKGIQRSQTSRTKDTSQTNTIFINVSEGDSSINVNSTNNDISYISFTNVSTGESGYISITYTSTFTNTIQWTLSGGDVYANNGSASLSNETNKVDLIEYYCVSSSFVVINISKYE
jgi:hypothetical protein